MMDNGTVVRKLELVNNVREEGETREKNPTESVNENDEIKLRRFRKRKLSDTNPEIEKKRRRLWHTSPIFGYIHAAQFFLNLLPEWHQKLAKETRRFNFSQNSLRNVDLKTLTDLFSEMGIEDDEAGEEGNEKEKERIGEMAQKFMDSVKIGDDSETGGITILDGMENRKEDFNAIEELVRNLVSYVESEVGDAQNDGDVKSGEAEVDIGPIVVEEHVDRIEGDETEREPTVNDESVIVAPEEQLLRDADDGFIDPDEGDPIDVVAMLFDIEQDELVADSMEDDHEPDVARVVDNLLNDVEKLMNDPPPVRKSNRLKRPIQRFEYEEGWIVKRRKYSNAVPNPTPKIRKRKVQIPLNPISYKARVRQPLLPPPPAVLVPAPFAAANNDYLELAEDAISRALEVLQRYDYGHDGIEILRLISYSSTSLKRLKASRNVTAAQKKRFESTISRLCAML